MANSPFIKINVLWQVDRWLSHPKRQQGAYFRLASMVAFDLQGVSASLQKHTKTSSLHVGFVILRLANRVPDLESVFSHRCTWTFGCTNAHKPQWAISSNEQKQRQNTRKQGKNKQTKQTTSNKERRGPVDQRTRMWDHKHNNYYYCTMINMLFGFGN